MEEKLKKERIQLIPTYVHAEEDNLHTTIRALFESALIQTA